MFNNKTKTFLLLTLVFIAILGVSSASATEFDYNKANSQIVSDAINEDISSAIDNTESDVMENTTITKNTQSNLKSEGEGTFTDLNSAISTNDEITLEKNYVKAEDESVITINKNLIIDGKGNTISSNNGSFEITPNSEVTFKNINFIGGTGSNSIFEVEGTLNMINCTVSNHDALAVAIVASNAIITVEDSTFKNIGTRGAFYFLYSQATFKNINFINCSNTVYGGAITFYNSGNYLIENCTFKNNVASIRGGAVYSKGNLTVKDSIFIENEALGKSEGSVLYLAGDVYLYNNTMTDNKALTAEIFNDAVTFHTPVIITINDSECEEGSSAIITATVTDDCGNPIELYSANTGIVRIDDELNMTAFNFTIEDKKFNVTEDENNKGLINVTIVPDLPAGNYTIDAETWDEEFVNPIISTGILTVTEAPVTQYSKVQKMIDEAEENDVITLDLYVKRGSSETTVTANKSVTIDLNGLTWDANNGFGLIINNNANVLVKNGVFTNFNNTDPHLENYQGILANIEKGNLVLENVTVKNSSCPSFRPDLDVYIPSLVYVTSSSTFTLKNSTVIDNKGTFSYSEGKLSITDSVFNNNKLNQSFNTIVGFSGETSIGNTQFANNEMRYSVVFADTNSKSLTVNNVSFINNTGFESTGTAIKTSYGLTTIKDSVFLNNVGKAAKSKGGAIYSQGDLFVSNSKFVDNNVGKEGTIIYHGGYRAYTLNVTNSVLIPVGTKSAIFNEAENDIVAVVNYNYWGKNTTPSNYVKSGSYYDFFDDEIDCTPIEVNYWVVMNTSATPTENLKYGSEVEIKTSFDKYTDGIGYYDLEGSMPDMEIIFTADEGTFNPQVSTTKEGIATTTYTVKSEYAKITSTDSYVINEIELTAQEPIPEIITLNEGNWTSYFDENNNLRAFIVPGSQLRFEGEFNNRNMIINVPVNLTTADKQAKLNNCTITITADNVNMTKIEMTSVDNEYEFELLVKGVSNTIIEDNTFVMTNNADKKVTNTIIVTGGEDNIIRNNSVTTTGPEDAIVYVGENNDIIETVYAISIKVNSSSNIIIEKNTITTKANDVEADDLGTVFGVYVFGMYETDEFGIVGAINSPKIYDNIINTESNVYAYGMAVHNAEDAVIDNNTITVTSDKYSNCLYTALISYSKINNNSIHSIANELTYGIISNGHSDLTSNAVYPIEENIISNNTVNCESQLAWGIELFLAEANTITDNEIKITADNGVAVGLADAAYTNIACNNMLVDVTMNDGVDSFDTITAYPTGVKIGPSGDPKIESTENMITYNNITVTTSSDDKVPAVNLSSAGNQVYENTLFSPLANGDNAVLDNLNANDIHNNYPGDIIVTDTTYSQFFDKNGNTLPIVLNGSRLITSGPIYNKNFTFDNVEVEFTNDGTAVLYNTTITVTGEAKIVLDGVVIDNTNMNNSAIIIESEENVLNNSNIKITDDSYIHAVQIDANNNIIENTRIDAVMASANVAYGPAPYYVGTPRSSALYITSSGNKVNNLTVNIDGTLVTSDEIIATSASIDAIDIQSPDAGLFADNNRLTNVTLSSKGSKYVYGINFGRATNTIVENININVESDYYADAIQLFDTNTISINGQTTTKAGYQGYGVYSTGMGTTYSQNINLTNLKLDVDATDATGVLLEGVDIATIINSVITVNGDNVTTIETFPDWMGHNPKDITINNVKVDITAANKEPAMYFANADNVSITDSEIRTTGESQIKFINSTNSKVTDNTIVIDDIYTGDYGVVYDNKGVTVNNNIPVSEVIDNLKDKLNETEAKLNETLSKLNDTQSDISELYKELEALLKQLQELQKQIEQLKAAENTTLTIDKIQDAKYNDEIIITGRLTDKDGNSISNQEITIIINKNNPVTVTTENGVYTHKYNAKKFGTTTITVNYAGLDKKYNPSNITTSFELTKQDTIITVNATSTAKYNDKVTITGTFKDANGNALANSNVVIKINDNKYTVKTNLNGEFEYIYTAGTVGENVILFAHSGNDKYNPTNTSITINVDKKDTQLIIDDISPIAYKDKVTITGKFINADGTALIKSNVKLTVNGETVTVKTDNKGVFSLNYTANSTDDIIVTASYAGNAKYNGCNATQTFTVDKKATILTIEPVTEVTKGETVTITGKFTNADNEKLINSKVVIYVNGNHHTVLTNNKGVYEYTFTPNIGEYEIVVKYFGNVKYMATNTTMTFVVN